MLSVDLDKWNGMGWGGGRRDVQEEGDMCVCVCIAGSLHCIA